MVNLIREAKDLGILERPTVFKRRVEFAEPAIIEAEKRGLSPTPYFVEAWSYWHRAKQLQDMNLQLRPRQPVGDKLQELIPIYDTVNRRHAGFSNVLEQLWYGRECPKFNKNEPRGFAYDQFRGDEVEFLYLCLVHRATGSGASFEHDHGWRNTIVPDVAKLPNLNKMSVFVRRHPGPVGTSIGNQYPAVKKLGPDELGDARNSLQWYLGHQGPKLVLAMLKWLRQQKRKTNQVVGIQEAVEQALAINAEMGQKRFVFVLTAWVMDIAEYYPDLVDPNSDCFHGNNAVKAWEALFTGRGQRLYDGGARLFAELTGTWPMDVEDVMCDSIRWVNNYVPKRGFDDVRHLCVNSAALKEFET